MTQEKVTIYHRSMFGVRAIEAKLVAHGTRSHAQYSSAPFVHFIPKRKRNPRTLQESYRPTMVIVRGWGHPAPPSDYLPPEQGSTPGIVVTRAKYLSCDPQYQTDFDSWFQGLGLSIVADYRNHDSYGVAS